MGTVDTNLTDNLEDISVPIGKYHGILWDKDKAVFSIIYLVSREVFTDRILNIYVENYFDP